MQQKRTYQAVIGLEFHVHLATSTKMFCGCRVAYGDPPNTHTCPVCLGHPGALPVTNEKAVELGVMAGLALNCDVADRAIFARKNYFYPDLPKGYQISQFDEPICTGGHIDVPTPKARSGSASLGSTWRRTRRRTYTSAPRAACTAPSAWSTSTAAARP